MIAGGARENSQHSRLPRCRGLDDFYLLKNAAVTLPCVSLSEKYKKDADQREDSRTIEIIKV